MATGGVVLLVAGFVALGAIFELMPLYAGFLLLWYLSSIDMLETGALPTPLLQLHERFDRVLIATVAASVYFGGTVLIGRRIMAAREQSA